MQPINTTANMVHHTESNSVPINDVDNSNQHFFSQ